MPLMDDLRREREERHRAQSALSAENLDLLQADRRRRRAEQLARLGSAVNANVKWFFGLVTALVCAWSLYSLGKSLGMPGWVGVAAAVAIDGAWLYCLLQVHLNRDTPYRALGAHSTSQLLLAASIALNFLHGMVQFGRTWLGVGSGLAFAFFPIILKVVISQSTPNPIAQIIKVPGGRSALKQMGRDRAQSALFALRERDKIDRYQIEQSTQVELARLDLQNNHQLSLLDAQLRTELDAVRGRPDEADTASGLSGGQSGPQRTATASTGPDTRTRQGQIYELSDPRDGQVRYVGQTTRGLKKRLSGHVKAPVGAAMQDWIYDLRQAGLVPEITQVCCAEPGKKLDRAEKERIWYHEEIGTDLINFVRYIPERNYTKFRKIAAQVRSSRPESYSTTNPASSPDPRPQAEIIRDLLDSGTPRELVVNKVLELKPEAKEDSVRRALSRELRSGNHL